MARRLAPTRAVRGALPCVCRPRRQLSMSTAPDERSPPPASVQMLRPRQLDLTQPPPNWRPLVTKLDMSHMPVLPPIHDAALLHAAMSAITGNVKLFEKLEYEGDRFLAERSAHTLAAHLPTPGKIDLAIFTHHMNTNVTWSYIALAYGFDRHRLIHLGGQSGTPSQDNYADSFEAWVGAAWRCAQQRRRAEDMLGWGEAFYNPLAWPTFYEELQAAALVTPTLTALSVTSVTKSSAKVAAPDPSLSKPAQSSSQAGSKSSALSSDNLDRANATEAKQVGPDTDAKGHPASATSTQPQKKTSNQPQKMASNRKTASASLRASVREATIAVQSTAVSSGLPEPLATAKPTATKKSKSGTPVMSLLATHVPDKSHLAVPKQTSPPPAAPAKVGQHDAQRSLTKCETKSTQVDVNAPAKAAVMVKTAVTAVSMPPALPPPAASARAATIVPTGPAAASPETQTAAIPPLGTKAAAAMGTAAPHLSHQNALAAFKTALSSYVSASIELARALVADGEQSSDEKVAALESACEAQRRDMQAAAAHYSQARREHRKVKKGKLSTIQARSYLKEARAAIQKARLPINSKRHAVGKSIKALESAHMRASKKAAKLAKVASDDMPVDSWPFACLPGGTDGSASIDAAQLRTGAPDLLRATTPSLFVSFAKWVAGQPVRLYPRQ